MTYIVNSTIQEEKRFNKILKENPGAKLEVKSVPWGRYYTQDRKIIYPTAEEKNEGTKNSL